MLTNIKGEALARIAAARTFLQIIEANERTLRVSDVAVRAMKGLIFIQNYAVYEFVVVQSVNALIRIANSRSVPLSSARIELLSMALNPDFATVIDGSIKKTWDNRSNLLRRTRSNEVMNIKENLIPKDGSHFRPAQLRTIWELFGISQEIVPNPRLLGYIHEMVDNRNKIAHGDDAPEHIGRRYTIADLKRRIDDTELICTHVMATITSYAASSTAFR